MKKAVFILSSLTFVLLLCSYDRNKVVGYIQEAEYYTKKAEAFERDAAYYLKRAQKYMGDAEYYSKNNSVW